MSAEEIAGAFAVAVCVGLAAIVGAAYVIAYGARAAGRMIRGRS